jgi:hypothetical protein
MEWLEHVSAYKHHFAPITDTATAHPWDSIHENIFDDSTLWILEHTSMTKIRVHGHGHVRMAAMYTPLYTPTVTRDLNTIPTFDPMASSLLALSATSRSDLHGQPLHKRHKCLSPPASYTMRGRQPDARCLLRVGISAARSVWCEQLALAGDTERVDTSKYEALRR